MQYKKQTKDNINIGVINTDRFKTNVINFSFVSTTNGKDNAYSNFLTSILVYNTKKYNTKIKFSKKLEDLYSCNIYSDFTIMGKVKIINFTLEFINSKYLEENIDKKVIDLLFEVIFNPNITKNKGFDSDTFKLIKKNILNTLTRINEYPNIYSLNNFLKTFNNTTPTAYSSIGEEKHIKNMDEKKLYEYYKTLFNMNLDISIVGDNIDEKLITYMLKKLKTYNIKRMSIKGLYINNKIKDKVKTVKETKEFNQSQLLIGYKMKDLTLHQKNYVLPIYNLILGGDINSILFKTLREKHNLCYGVTSSFNKYDNTLIVTSGINKSNYDVALKYVKESVKEMNKEKNIKDLIDVAKKNISTSLNTFYDDIKQMTYYILLNNYEDKEDIETRKKIFDSVTVEEVLEMNKHIKLDTIYFLEGEKENG